MDESTMTFRSPSDGIDVHTHVWRPDGDPRAIVQLAHGMGEHSARYARLAEALTRAGYVVHANDHRGHGVTAGGPDGHGRLGEGGWQALIDDIRELGRLARGEYPGLQLALIGHSMGSFAAQQLLLDHSREVDAVILTGSTAPDILSQQIDPDSEVDLSAFNEPFEQRTGYEWLSRDPAEVDAYVADDDCGFGLDPAGTRGMVEGLAATGDPDRLREVRPDLPILVLSGSDDPLANGGQLVELVGQRYRDAGVSDVHVTLYPQARHEILNETNRDEVTSDIIAFLDRTVGS